MPSQFKTLLLAPCLLMFAFGVNATELPRSKQTVAGLYLTAQEAYDLRSKDPRSLLIDIRTLAEVNFLGMPTVADANIEYERMDAQGRFNQKKGSISLSPNLEFTQEVARLVEELGLSKDSPIILMCRSGKRSAQAANELTLDGFTRVYTITDGYEGDIAKDGQQAGQRAINGWKNSNLPWSYKLELSKLHSVRRAREN